MGFISRIKRRIKGERKAPSPRPRTTPAPTPPPVAPAPAVTGRLPRSEGGAPVAVGAGEAVLADVETVLATLGAGQRPLLVNHWATWCEPCVAEIPALIELVTPHADALDVLGVGWELFSLVGDPEIGRAQVARFAEKHGMAWGTLVCTDPPPTLFSRMGLTVQTVPQTFLFAADGTLAHHVPGVVEGATLAELAKAVELLLKE